MRWRAGPVRKRHVPETERLRQLAAKLKGQADKLSREADALLAEAAALEGANKPVHPKSGHAVKKCNRLVSSTEATITAIASQCNLCKNAVQCTSSMN